MSTTITDAVLIAIAIHLPNITILDIANNTPITDTGMIALCNSCVKIKKLNITGLVNIFVPTIHSIDEKLTELEYIEFNHLFRLSGQIILEKITKKWTNLITMDLINCILEGNNEVKQNVIVAPVMDRLLFVNHYNVVLPATTTDHLTNYAINSISNIVNCFKNIRIFTCDAMLAKLTDDSVIYFSKRPNLLTELTITNAELITDKSVLKVLACSKHLQKINFARCINLTNKTANYIADHLPMLQNLNLSHNAITNQAVENLAAKCKWLQFVDFSGCAHVTQTAVDEMELKCKYLIDVQYTAPYIVKELGEKNKLCCIQ